ncbi:uncharacterized protein CLUP02_00980 [Colletotrichum lupini]|uniref:Uncharacterized protein n=1 Tax=Colletotrichum lupini TaxID=145971 RepID=A0A9Q8W996_9PEZI|nr:uncharacterized protein CLUP02_00980 [Colletotrichum lupini]UQC74332.1 hypothetical protein CLUP02_00980 [Colletotrichum lupini]
MFFLQFTGLVTESAEAPVLRYAFNAFYYMGAPISTPYHNCPALSALPASPPSLPSSALPPVLQNQIYLTTRLPVRRLVLSESAIAWTGRCVVVDVDSNAFHSSYPCLTFPGTGLTTSIVLHPLFVVLRRVVP